MTPPTPPRHIGPYQILGHLGSGGMGEVFRARDTRLGRDVALKLLPDSVPGEAARLERFEQEARAAAALNHPNILVVHDVGVHEGRPYLVTELLEGESLRQIAARGRVPLDRALSIAGQVATALAEAHEHGIVHRDVKPENVFVARDGHAKLLDFGVAKLVEPMAQPGAADQLPTRGLETVDGALLGTPSYMAPEQVRGRSIDGRADIFALGALLFELLSGKRAFSSDSLTGTLAAILEQDPPDLRQLRPEVPDPVAAVVSRCLEKDPRSRFQSARDLVFLLDSLRRTPPGEPPAERAAAGTGARHLAQRERVIWLALTAALTGALLWLALPLQDDQDDRLEDAAPVRFVVNPPPDTVLSGMLDLTPDGRTLAFVASGSDGVDRLYVRSFERIEPLAIEGSEGAQFPFFSPAGDSVGFFARERVRRVDLDTLEVSTLARAHDPRGGAWSSRGVIAFAADAGRQVLSIPEDGGEPTAVEHLDTPAGLGYRWLEFLPDGDHLLYFWGSGDSRRDGVHLTSLSGLEPRRLVAADSSAALIEPGRLVFFRREGSLFSQSFDPERLETFGSATPLVEGVWWDALTTNHKAFAAASGVLVFQTGGVALSELRWHDRDGSEIGVVTEPGAYIEPALSPSGDRAAVTRGNPETGAIDVMIRDLERGGWSRLSATGPSATPVWSPDGRRVAYATFPNGRVLARDASGAGEEELLVETGSFWALEDWSPDGRHLLFSPTRGGSAQRDLWIADLEAEREPVPLLTSPADEYGGRFSPDGRHLAYTSDETGQPEVYLQSFPSLETRIRASVGGGNQPAWRQDGRELYYVGVGGALMAVEIDTTSEGLAAGAPTRLFSTRILPLVESRNQYDATADGERFLVNSPVVEPGSQRIEVWLDG